jgi:hypothetical protein
MAVPAVSFNVQVRLLRLQYLFGSVQSESAKQPSVDGTQCRLVQVLLTHSFAFVQSVLVGDAHVLVVVLHSPLVHTACAFCVVQLPSCRTPSFGIATPGPSVGLQVRSERSHQFPLAQSPSAQQPLVGGTQWLFVHLLLTQSALPRQLVPLSTPQLGTAALHFPDKHTAGASLHMPVCRVSVGMVVPVASLLTQL